MLYTHPGGPGECAGCGTCGPVRPVEAICCGNGLPGQRQVYAGENAKLFTDPLPGRDEPPGSPGGAGKPGTAGAGTPFAAARRHGNGHRDRPQGCQVAGPRAGTGTASLEEAVMTVIIYGDFNCPYSYLASQRADRLRGAGVAVDWRAVEHDRGLPAGGLPSGSDRASWSRELTEVASLALPGEQVPAEPPALISNTGAAVAAYAEAVSDGVADELRGSLFGAIWARGLNLSSPHDVRRLVTDLMWPREDVVVRLASPDFPSLLLRDADMTRIVRRSGGAIALNGVPLTTAGWRRVRQWRQEWLALPSQVIPAVIGADHIVRPGVEGLRYLAGSAGTAGLPANLPAQAEPAQAERAQTEPAPGRSARQAAAARAA